MTSPWMLIVVLQASAPIACPPDDAASQLGFIVAPDAFSIECVSDPVSPQMSYKLPESYPAKGALTKIATALEAGGWEPLPEDFLNPGVPSAHVRGWSSFVDGTVEPNDKVLQWLAQWRNSRRDVVVYGVVYRWPATTTQPRLDTARVLVRYLPCSVVRDGRKALGLPQSPDAECPGDAE